VGEQVTWMPLAQLQAQLEQKVSSGTAVAADDHEMWWGFSSSSTSLPAVKTFLGEDGLRIIYTIDGGSSAREVRRYSAFQGSVAVPDLPVSLSACASFSFSFALYLIGSISVVASVSLYPSLPLPISLSLSL